MPKSWLVTPGSSVSLRDLDPGSTKGSTGGQAEALAALPAMTEQLRVLQDRLWAESKRSLLVVLQAMDTGGKDGTIKHVFTGVNPQACRVESFKAPVGAELAHDFLWRVHQVSPAAGEVVIFNRSHYEDVLVPRVHHLVPDDVWRDRYRLINAFEELLGHGGTRVVKLFLHISKDEQARRLQARLDNPDKRWKFKEGDLAERAHWGDYQRAYEGILEHTSTTSAPWYVVPADHKWYRNWVVSTILTATLTDMDPRLPEVTIPPDVTVV